MQMKRIVIVLYFALLALASVGQKQAGKPFEGIIGNAEYKIYLQINFYKNNVSVPGQELFGELPGFLGDSIDSRKWLFTSVKLNKKTATLQIINDYGSEDLVATLTQNKDNTYTLNQLEGSRIRIARNRKWVKLPKEIIFIRTK